jgi:hypothetical protein
MFLNKVMKFLVEYKLYFIIIFLLISIIFINKLLFFVILFSALDLIVSYLDTKHIDLCQDFFLYGIIIFSYSSHLKYIIPLIILFLVNRLLLGKLSNRHFIKIPIIVIIACLAKLLNFWNLSYLGVFLFLFRYILEYLLEFILTGKITFKRIPKRVLHLIGAYLFFSFFGGDIIVFFS